MVAENHKQPKENLEMKQFQQPQDAATRFAACLEKAKAIVASYREQAPEGFDPQNAETLVADVPVIPEVFVPYSVEETAIKSELISSGILRDDPQFAERANIGFDAGLTATSRHGGQFTSMPFWQALTGADEVISDTSSLTTGKMTGANEMAVIHNRAKAWSDNDMASIISASNIAEALISLLGAYWAQRIQQMCLSTLVGVFGGAGMAGNLLDVHLTTGGTFTVANYFTLANFIDAKQKLGDAKEKLTAIIMHSKTEAAAEKEGAIVYVPTNEQGMLIKTYGGKRVIIDDTITVDVETGTDSPSNVYSTYLFAEGAFGYGVGTVDAPIRGAAQGSTWAAEWARETLAGQNVFVNRRRMIMHPRGFKWANVAMAGISPTNAELATASNWTRVWEAKNVPMVRILHNNLGG